MKYKFILFSPWLLKSPASAGPRTPPFVEWSAELGAGVWVLLGSFRK